MTTVYTPSYRTESTSEQRAGYVMLHLGELIPGKSLLVVDEEKLEARNLGVLIVWFWPVYLTGTILISRWVLKQKNRSLHWLWLTLFLLPITPIILAKKETNGILEEGQQK